MHPVNDVGFIRMNERTGDDHHLSVLQPAAWRDANSKITDLPIHNLPSQDSIAP